jgi:tetratricopeptide (TPR) repeat protein
MRQITLVGMNARAVIVGCIVALLLAGVAGGAWWQLQPPAEPADTEPTADSEPLPIPPVPPRIAQGDDYEHCLAMLTTDPEGAQALAETWQTAGGGDGAEHCLALSRIALGDPAEGAAMLEKLAGGSRGSPAARVAIYRQATQAWLMTSDAARAFGAGTLALALTPDDADLLIDRAVAAGSLQRWQDAVDDLSRALDLDPRRPDALVLRGSAWRHLGHDELAQDDVDRALAFDPDNAEALLERGIIRQRHSDTAGARDDWEKAIALAPDSPTADLAEQNLALLEAGPERH